MREKISVFMDLDYPNFFKSQGEWMVRASLWVLNGLCDQNVKTQI